MAESDSPLGRVRDAFSLSLFHANALVQRESAALLRGEREAAKRLMDAAHRLVGTAGSLGFDALAAPCRALESSLSQHDDRWHARLFAVVRELEEAASPLRDIALSLRRGGSARALTILSPDAIDEGVLARTGLAQVSVAAGCPHPPRGVLFVDARRDLMARVRSARTVWGGHAVVAVAPRASEAETLLALRAGANLVHAADIDSTALSITAWSALAPPLTNGTIIWFDNDPLRSSSARAALEPLGAKVHPFDELSKLTTTLRKQWPHLAVIDSEHPDGERLFDELTSIAPTVPVVSLGAARWCRQSLDTQRRFIEVVKQAGVALLDALGPDDLPPVDIDATTQTVRLSKADLGGLAKKKGGPA